MKHVATVLAVCAIPAAALAEPYPMPNPTGYDPYAADAIARADYAVAEERLARRLGENAADVPALVNLAAIMIETDRMARASSLFERVLAAEDMLLESADGTPVWAHQIAASGLQGRVTVGSRD